ncbi:nitroreductase/quinone reductase family protein [Promicromonospora sp. NPDC023987]|uniref:nitroreductase/quinone reductase family protein n=1 Tax=Promicromonospora sp. NPDC023987 TaxID=3155360 RepID=UPI0033D0E993
MPIDFNQQIIEEFRANHGRVGGPFEGGRLLLLTTTGARSGATHTTPVGYLPDGDRVLVIASAAGAPRHPAWFHNLKANRHVTVENGTFTYDATATVLDGAERDRLFARAAEADPGWAEYQAKTDRVIPVVALEEIPGPPNVDADTMGGGLKAIHDAFRRELALVRAEIARSGPRVGAQLRVNCLTVCSGLHHHHTIEREHMFPALGEQHPALAEPLKRLQAEHEAIAELLGDLQTLLADDATPADPAALLTEVERLTHELEGHLDYEEEHLIPALDGIPM